MYLFYGHIVQKWVTLSRTSSKRLSHSHIHEESGSKRQVWLGQRRNQRKSACGFEDNDRCQDSFQKMCQLLTVHHFMDLKLKIHPFCLF